jgi:hypothetical protein
MEITLTRIRQTKDSTLGSLTVKNFYCYTLEDGRREEKEAGKTRIPAGKYRLALRYYGGFYQRYSELYRDPHPMIEICDVPDFSDVLIHRGNKVDDTRGCILVGERFSLVGADYELYDSARAYDALRKALIPEFGKWTDIWLIIKEEFPGWGMEARDRARQRLSDMMAPITDENGVVR